MSNGTMLKWVNKSNYQPCNDYWGLIYRENSRKEHLQKCSYLLNQDNIVLPNLTPFVLTRIHLNPLKQDHLHILGNLLSPSNTVDCWATTAGLDLTDIGSDELDA